jgi:hypothetical protein
MTLALLHTLHENPSLAFRRVGEGLKVIPAVPPEARPVLAHFKAALLQALEDGERVEARALLSSPFRLLPHAAEGEGGVLVQGVEEGKGHSHSPSSTPSRVGGGDLGAPAPFRSGGVLLNVSR